MKLLTAIAASLIFLGVAGRELGSDLREVRSCSECRGLEICFRPWTGGTYCRKPPPPPPRRLVHNVADQCGRARKVSCPAQCNEGEVPDQTQKCVFNKELYKKDGKGCITYVPECWCKVPCPTLPENSKI